LLLTDHFTGPNRAVSPVCVTDGKRSGYWLPVGSGRH